MELVKSIAHFFALASIDFLSTATLVFLALNFASCLKLSALPSLVRAEIISAIFGALSAAIHKTPATTPLFTHLPNPETGLETFFPCLALITK
jgi:hypothetical protein